MQCDQLWLASGEIFLSFKNLSILQYPKHAFNVLPYGLSYSAPLHHMIGLPGSPGLVGVMKPDHLAVIAATIALKPVSYMATFLLFFGETIECVRCPVVSCKLIRNAPSERIHDCGNSLR